MVRSDFRQHVRVRAPCRCRHWILTRYVAILDEDGYLI